MRISLAVVVYLHMVSEFNPANPEQKKETVEMCFGLLILNKPKSEPEAAGRLQVVIDPGSDTENPNLFLAASIIDTAHGRERIGLPGTEDLSERKIISLNRVWSFETVYKAIPEGYRSEKMREILRSEASKHPRIIYQ